VSYRLDLDGDVPGALRAVAADQLADAEHNLREKRAEDPVVAVHEARKDLKKVRSLLRLARPGMKAAPRRAANGALREIAAQLADVRDADVMIETVEALHDRFAGQVPARAFSVVRRRFETAATQSRWNADAAISDDVVAALDAQRHAVAGWPVDRCDRAALAEGAAVAYARGRDELRAARERPTVEALHEWRKRVKDLWYHARLLEEAWPGPLEALAKEAHTLSDHLGDDHDLAVLAERLAAQEWPPSVNIGTFVAFCHHRRAEFQAEAFALGSRVYAETPKALRRRLEAYLAA